MSIKLVALDLDGTLFDSNGRISAKNREALQKARVQGIHIAVSTGRPYVGLPLGEMKELGIRYAITTNGSAIYDSKSDKCLYENTMDPRMVSEVLRPIEERYVYCDLFIEGKAYGRRDKIPMIDHLDLKPAIREYIRTTRQYTDSLSEFVREQGKGVQKITLDFVKDRDTLIDYEKTEKIVRSYNELTVVSGGCSNLEITGRGINKGQALRELCRILKILPEEAMACGDSENDLALIKSAGVGVAMANAEQCVLEAAEYITLSNDEDGVAAAVQHFCI